MTKVTQEKPAVTRRMKSRIPAFQTIEEEAAFWDRHDTTEFADEFAPVTDVTFVKASPKKGITVRLDEDTAAALTLQAREKGIGPSTLARMWILERLREAKSASTSSQ